MAMNRNEWLHECNERFGRSITWWWVYSFLRRHADQLFETKSVPQETPRLDVPRVFLEAAIDGFRDHVHNACAEFVFNLDEIGISEWEDRHERRVIVLSVMRWQTIFHGANLGPEACVSRGLYFHSRRAHDVIFVYSQLNDAVERKLKLEGNRLGVDFILRWRSKPYMSEQFLMSTFQKFFFRALMDCDRAKNFLTKKLSYSWIIAPFICNRRHYKWLQIIRWKSWLSLGTQLRSFKTLIWVFSEPSKREWITPYHWRAMKPRPGLSYAFSIW
jgi:hypothetical protein